MYDTLFSIESGQLTSLRQYIKRVKNFKQSYIEKEIKHQSIGNKKKIIIKLPYIILKY